MTPLELRPYPSPNFGERRDGAKPDLVVVHFTAMQSTKDALERLCSAEFEVSAHYLIAPEGIVFHLVDENARAWHAGLGRWGDVTDANSRSIGIELANSGRHPFAAAQMDALELLLEDIMERHSIAPERVIAHSDMAPARKVDPGPRFDWRRLAMQGLSVWPIQTPECSPEEATFRDALVAFGYDSDVSSEILLAAFRARFRPRFEGPLDGQDMAMALNLAKRFPVDPERRNA